MGLRITNAEVESLAEELALAEGTSRTEVIRRALLDRKQKTALEHPACRSRLLAFLEDHVWPTLPKGASRRLSKAEVEEILGYGPGGAPL